MIPSFLQPLLPPAHERFTLLLNHVLGAEPQAVQRLLPFAGRRLAFQAGTLEWRFEVTRAGLLETVANEDAAQPAALTLRLADTTAMDAARGAMAGQRPRLDIQGDADFAEAVNWLVANLRWDVEDDLARVVGDAPTHQMMRAARGAGDGLRLLAEQAARLLNDRSPR